MRAFSGSTTGFIGAQVDQGTADLSVTFLDEESALITPAADEYLGKEIAVSGDDDARTRGPGTGEELVVVGAGNLNTGSLL